MMYGVQLLVYISRNYNYQKIWASQTMDLVNFEDEIKEGMNENTCRNM